MSTLRKEIELAINRNSAENGSDTPDFILAEYLTDCLAAWDKAARAREKWYRGDNVRVPKAELDEEQKRALTAWPTVSSNIEMCGTISVPPDARCIRCGRAQCDTAVVAPDGTKRYYHADCVGREARPSRFV